MKNLKFFTATFFLGTLGLIIWWKAPVPTAEGVDVLNVVAESEAVNEQVNLDVMKSVSMNGLPTTNKAKVIDQENTGYTWKTASTPGVLKGTDVDGGLKLDANGHLLLAIDVKDFFDYFLSAVGEVTPEQAIAEIHSQLLERLPSDAAKQAMRLLNDYLDYQKNMTELMAKPLIPADQQDYAYFAKTMKESFDEVKMLRRQYMSPDAVEAFFGLEESFSEFSVKNIEIQADVSLSDSEKQQRKQALENKMPEQMRVTAEASRARIDLVTQAQTLINDGADSGSVRRLLESKFESPEVEHILGFYRQEQQWKGRLDSYLSRKQRLVQDGLSDTDQQKQLSRLRQEYFNEDEIPRLKAEEAIARKVAANSSASDQAFEQAGS